ncbi:MAG TPA: hemerythrin domain-containing protein [Candidatus Dormibacteraeota bacterium]|nr:hemerythrin domain-containing protein [Candidatus Dormibacteraeota bacterium]
MVDRAPIPIPDRDAGGRGDPGRGEAGETAGVGGRAGAEAGEDLDLRVLFGALLEAAERIEAALAAPPEETRGPLGVGHLARLPDLLVDRVVPRLRAEEEVLHPAIGPDADLASCRRGHDRIRAGIEALSSLAGRLSAGRRPSRAAERILRDRLRHLSVLLRDHVREEARACAPALEAMGAEWRGELERALAGSEAAARRAVRLVAARAPEATEAVVLRSNPRAGRAFVVGLGDIRPPDRDHGPA